MVDLDLCVLGGFALVMGWCMEADYHLAKGNMRFASMLLSMGDV